MSSPTDTPHIDVYIPVYNDRKHIARAVRSALNQSDVELRVLVSDNASTDGTYEILEEVAKTDSRLVIHRNSENIGMMGNIRRYADLVNAPYYMFLCSDDYLNDPTALRQALSLIESNPDMVSVYCDLDFVDQNGRHILFNKFERDEVFSAEVTMRKSLIKTRNRFGIPLLHKTEISKEYPYNVEVTYTCDIWHSYKVGQHGICGHIAAPLIANSYTGENLTRTLMQKAKAEYRFLSELENIPLTGFEKLRQSLNFYRTLASKWLFFSVIIPFRQRRGKSGQ